MILVTGATGLLGHAVVRELLARGESVRVLARPSRTGAAGRSELAGLDVQLVQGDLGDAAVVRQAVIGCRAVVHSAAMVHIGYQRLKEARQANVKGTEIIAEACRQEGCRLIYVSTVDTLPAARSREEPLRENDAGLPKTACTYVISKTEAEAKVTEAIRSGLDAIIAHPGFMLAPYDWKPSSGAMFLAVHKVPYVVAPRGTASVCDARDVAAALVASIQRGGRGEHYILAGENIGYPELCTRMLEVMGKTKRVIRMGPIIPAAARCVDFWNRISGAEERLFNGAAIAMGQLHHAYDSSKAEQQLGYHRRDLTQTLEETWQWLKQHHYGS